MMLKSLYQKVDIHENDGEDDPVDQSGYTGQFYRPLNKNLEPLTEQELVQIIHKNNKMTEIVKLIYGIDRQHNGYVTTTELDDILKLNYKKELANKDLRLIMRKYASIQNRVLVDYKQFRDSLLQQLTEIKEVPKASVLQNPLPLSSTSLKLISDQSKASRMQETLNNFLNERKMHFERSQTQV
jgi:hypothetical protein